MLLRPFRVGGSSQPGVAPLINPPAPPSPAAANPPSSSPPEKAPPALPGKLTDEEQANILALISFANNMLGMKQLQDAPLQAKIKLEEIKLKFLEPKRLSVSDLYDYKIRGSGELTLGAAYNVTSNRV